MGITIRQALEGLHFYLSPSTVRQWCRDGRIPGAVKVGREWQLPDGTDLRYLRLPKSRIPPHEHKPIIGLTHMGRINVFCSDGRVIQRVPRVLPEGLCVRYNREWWAVQLCKALEPPTYVLANRAYRSYSF